MTQRERSLFLILLAVGGFVLVFGGFVAVQRLVAGLGEKDQEIEGLQREVSDKETKLLTLTRAQRKLDHWKAVSLPPDLDTARSRYRAFLQELCRHHQLHVRQIRDSGPARTAASSRTATSYTALTYQVQVEGTLPRLVGFLREFYAINLPHQVRDISIANEGTAADGRLDITLKVEALVLPNAPQREFLLPVPDARVLCLETTAGLGQGPTGLASALWLVSPAGALGGKKLAPGAGSGRDYPRLVSKNIFAGLRPPPAAPPPTASSGPDRDFLKAVQLAAVTSSPQRTEASLRNRLTDGKIRLTREGPSATFELRDGRGQVVLRGRVKAIDERSVEFLAGQKSYRLSVGESLYEVLRPDKLTAEQLESLTKKP
jgi:hypothetical protein